MSETKKPKLEYVLHQRVVYPLQGVGEIQAIEQRDFNNEPLLYYIIYFESSDMTIMTPVERATELGIRAIVSREAAEQALEMIGMEYEPVLTDWKLRYQNNLELLRQGGIEEITSVVRMLYHRSMQKELPILERKLLDSAMQLLIDEIGLATSQDAAVVEASIIERLRKAPLVEAVAQIMPEMDIDIGDDINEEEDEET